MIRSYQEFNVLFAKQNFNKNNFTVPFRIVLRFTDDLIEKYCLETWPDLMVASAYSLDQAKEALRMQQYIKSKLTEDKQKNIHQLFYDKWWLDPFKLNNKISKVNFTEFDCKIWTEKIPYLELSGELELDLQKMLNLYIEKYIKLNVEKRVMSEKLELYFNKNWPQIFTYRGDQQFKKYILDKMLSELNSWSVSKIKTKIEKKLKIKKINELKKSLSWKGNRTLELEINDIFYYMKKKAPKAILPMAGGYLLYKILK